jgi:MFS family permease
MSVLPTAERSENVGDPLPVVSVPLAQRAIYGREFWLTYLSNTALMVAISLMYRYADFVLFLGGNEWTVGRIVGVGMIGSLVMRCLQGMGIDSFGTRRVWLLSMALYVLSLLGHLLVTSASSPGIYALRILYATSVAGAFGASITSVSRSLPLGRMAEVIGSLGTSAFIAMALGPQLGDLLFGGGQITRGALDTMFIVAAALGTLSLIAAEMATRGELPPRQRKRPHLFWLLRRYHPGTIMALGVVIGIGLVLPTTFLPTFTKDLNISRTGSFFTAYATTAFIARVATRRVPQLIGIRPLIFAGLVTLAISLVCYLPVETEWGLVVPGLFAGASHAVLFPAVTAQGSAAFPNRYRGLGTTVMLAMLDIGSLVGAPLIGGLVEYSKVAGWPPYPTTFSVLGAGIVFAGVLYAFSGRR